MSRPVSLGAEAERELDEACRWYDSQRPGLGFEFLISFDATVESVRRHPESREIVALRTRRALLRRFPYFILYTFDGRRLFITAVFHTHRDPRGWAGRVRENVPAVHAYAVG